MCGHLSPDVRQCDPQWKNDGQDEEVGDLFPEGVRPGQAQRLVFILLFVRTLKRNSLLYINRTYSYEYLDIFSITELNLVIFKCDESHTSSPPATPFMGGVTSTATFVLFGMFLSTLNKKRES